MYGEGISKAGEIIDLAVELDIVKKSGSWFSYDGNRLGQGRDAVKSLIKDNPELMEELETKIKAKVSGDPAALEDMSEPNEEAEELAKTVDKAV